MIDIINVSVMTVEQLKNFVIVAEVLNFHKASSTIYIAQPALSRQIKNLEEEIGARLFDRTKKQVKLTAAGEFFKHEVSRILKHLGEAQKRAALVHHGEAGDVNIGHVSSAMHSVLPYFLKTVTTKYPNLKIGLLENSCKLIFNKVLDHELDFGIVPNELGPEGFNSALLYKENFVVVVPENCKIDIKKNSVLKSLAKADWILPARGDGQSYNEVIYAVFQNNGFTPNVVFQSPNASTNLRMVSEGLGVTLIAKSAVKGVNLNVKYFELANIPQKVEMRFLWLKEREDELKEYITLFLKIFREIKHI